jgi:hypothetical protein
MIRKILLKSKFEDETIYSLITRKSGKTNPKKKKSKI